MNKPKYLYKSKESLHVFEFISEGPKGQIRKVVQYSETRISGVYNSAFGDLDLENLTINAFLISKVKD